MALSKDRCNTAMVLINGSLTAVNSCINTANQLVAGAYSRTSGLAYYEVNINFWTSNAALGMGYANATASLTSHLGVDVNSWGFFPGGQFTFNNAAVTPASGGGTANTGFTISGAINFNLTPRRAWFRVDNSSAWWGAGSGIPNPVTNTGGFDLGVVSGALYPVLATLNSHETLTVNMTGPFTNTIPAGYSAWEPGVGSLLVDERGRLIL